MAQDELENPSGIGSVALGLPLEMNSMAICRGMLTGWPQLTAARRTLAEVPQFRQAFRHSYASGQGLAIGEPQQLLAALAVNPGLLTNPTPPTDVYAWTVWLTLRTYEAARTISVALAQLPGLFGAAKEVSSAEMGVMVQTLLAGPLGLADTADTVATLTASLEQQLHLMGGSLKEAQAAYQQRGAAISNPRLASDAKGVFGLVTAHADARAATHALPYQLSDFEMTAAQVSAFAVIANMALALQSSVAAWQATKRQFQAAASDDLDKLGSLTYLQGPLKLATATQEWAALTQAMRDYSQRMLLLR